jgi:hypothetical protein
LEAGLYLMQDESAAPEYLGDIDKEGHLAWSEAAQGYTVLTETAWLMVSPSGEISELQSPPDIYQRPSVSPDGRMWAWWVTEDPSVPGVWVGPAGEPAQQVFDLEASEVVWSPDSQGLYIFSGYPMWDLLVASAPDFEPHRLPQAFDRPYAGSGLAFVQP